MKQISFTLFLFIVAIQSVFSQKMSDDAKITWANLGGTHKATVSVVGAFKTETGYLVMEKEVIHGPGGFHYFLEVFDNNMKSQKVTNISEEIDERNYRILDVVNFGENFILVTTRNFGKESKTETYIQLLDGGTGTIGSRQVIYDQSYERRNEKVSFNFTTSPNHKQLLVQIIPAYKKNEDQKVGFQLYGEDLVLKWDREEISLSVQDKKYAVLEVLVNDLGDVYLLGKNFEDAKFLGFYGATRIYKTSDNTVPFEILSFKDGVLTSNAIKVNEIGLIDIVLQFGKDNILHGVGYYTNKSSVRLNNFSPSIDGVLAITIDPQTGEASSVKRKEFDKAFLKDGLSQRSQDKLNKKNEKGKDLGYTSNLKIKDVIQHQDGTVSLVGEVYYVTSVTTYSSNGTSSTRYYYHYDDLVVTRVSSTGEIMSNAKIKKQTIFASPFGHSIVFDCNNKLGAIFTDNRANIIPNETRTTFKNSSGMRVKDKAMTLATVDESGNVTREGLVDYLGDKEHAHDALYKMDYDGFVLSNNEVLLLTYFGKKQFGFLRVSPK